MKIIIIIIIIIIIVIIIITIIPVGIMFLTKARTTNIVNINIKIVWI